MQLFVEKVCHDVDFLPLVLLLLDVLGDDIQVAGNALELIDDLQRRLRQHVHVLLELFELAQLRALRHDAGRDRRNLVDSQVALG